MLIRVRSSRANYRRGGVKFGKAKAWQEIDVEALSVGQLIQLGADRTVCIERQESDRAWSPMPSELRAECRRWLDEHHHRVDPALFDLKGEEGLAALRSVLDDDDRQADADTHNPREREHGEGGNSAALAGGDQSEGSTSAPALAGGTQSLGASGGAKGTPSDEAAAGKPAASNEPPAQGRRGRPAR